VGDSSISWQVMTSQGLCSKELRTMVTDVAMC
jgi:hypothetical protein